MPTGVGGRVNFVVLSQKGYDTLATCYGIVGSVLFATPSDSKKVERFNDITSLFSSQKSSNILQPPQEDFMGQYMKDFSFTSLAAQEKIGESVSFRAICGNVKAAWTDRAGFMCNVESSHTFKNVTADILLSVLDFHVLSALLNFNFRMLDKLVDYQDITKKIDFYNFGHFQVKGESVHLMAQLYCVFNRRLVSWRT